MSPAGPDLQARPRFAFLGLGEAGAAIAADLLAAGADVRGFDPRVAAPAGVQARNSEQDAVRDADFVLSLNSSHDARPALEAALPAVLPGALWIDANTASPGLKAALADTAGSRLRVVDVALMSPVPGRGLHTPMLASGDGAEQVAQTLRGFGASVDVIEGPAGAAISRKLLRSVFYKGLAAAVVEALEGARAAGLQDWLYENIATELAASTRETVDRLVTGTHQHARRRTDEMTAAAEQLTELGVQPRVATAARDLLADLRDRG